ncbi:hypothetical protein [Bacillus sp. N1-1]|uniref:hypothetical protein n=1 Tax=Bacillus sp. N1-1 TaxID=2682541 RepID=UPI0013173CF3|nr:hypothetical protein [Bacillus sp. N1-1]QHA92245.1 hypothetical protein GNK04_12860 [Bacillus sp. N1-1]
MQVKQESEIYESFVDFFHFSLKLVREISPKNRNLKFAVVNVQITLELFIKYYLVEIGYKEKIIKEGKEIDYKDFETVLKIFFSTTRWSYGEKQELKAILKARNSIVHKGLRSGWNDELAVYIIKCIQFIHGTMLNGLGISLLENYPKPNPISSNITWRQGIEKYIEKLNTTRNMPVFQCPECCVYSLIHSEVVGVGIDLNPHKSLDCLCCLTSYDVEVEAALMNCYKCSEPDSYLIDRLNGNEKQQHMGKCLECRTNTLVRRCYECEHFFHPSQGELNFENKYFCTNDCKEIYEER